MKANVNYSSRFRILKGGKVSLVVSALLGSVTLSFAAPSGGVVTSGSATISQSGNTTNINQSTSKASINWNKFNIASHETVNFNQPNVNSITLNRVIGNERSIIDGALNANGQVWILNSNGVLFGKNASINTSGLLATTKDISDTNFQKGNYSFTGDSTESVINQGTIKVKNNGYVIFASTEAKNSGTIEVVKGRVQLTSADEYTINLNGNSLINLSVDKGTLDALVENSGTILSGGGEVYLTTHAVDELLRGVVNNTGIIEANSLDGISGHVELYAHGGEANIAGTIKAKGGFVETSAKELSVASTTSIEASKWLLDPTNMIIESTGGSDITGASVSATAITNALSSADVELKADQDITVNENITWGDATKLKLTAGDEIYVNSTIENTNATNGGVYFNAVNRNAAIKFDATTGKVIINNINQLQWISQALNGNYELGSNLDASDTRNWNSDGSGGYYGFKQIGDNSTNNIDTRFTGNFDGKGYVIDGLYINRGGEDTVGLFGRTGAYGANKGTILNLGLTNVDIKGNSRVGGLVGYNNYSTITNSYTTGSISGYTNVGGLVGYNESSTITNSYSTSNITVNQVGGGLVGYNHRSEIINSYAPSEDLTGISFNDTLTNSYSTNSFNESTYAGFDFTNNWIIYEGHTRPLLRVFMTDLTVTANDITRTYNGTTYSGNEGVTYSIPTYDSSLVNGTLNYTLSGDLKNAGTATINADGLYSTSQQGYIIKYDSGTLTTNKKSITANYTTENKVYDGTTNAVVSGTLTGVIIGDTVALSQNANFIDKNAGNNKTITGLSLTGVDSGNYSISTTNSATADITKKDITVTGNSNTTTYNGTVQNTSGFTASGLVGGETIAVLDGVTGDSASGKNAGTYNTNLSGTDENYNLTFVDGSLVINKKDITVTGNSNTTTYNGTVQNTSGFTASGLVGGETIAVLDGVTGDSASGKNAGTYNTNLSGTDENYNLTFVDGSLVINKKDITVTANSDTTTYNGTVQNTSGFTASGLVGGETIAVLDGVTGDSASGKNAGTYNTNLSGTDENYNLTFVDGSLVINKKDITVTANSDTTTYNGTVQNTSGFTASGLVGGETIAVLDGVTGDSASGKNAGTYNTNLSGTDENYNLTFVDGSLVINKKDITVTANSDTTTYNGTVQNTSGFTASGLVGGETIAVLDGVTGDSASGKNAATYNTNLSGTDENYNLTFVDGSLVISKRALSLEAKKDYDGTADLTDFVTFENLVGDETLEYTGATANSKESGNDNFISNITLKDGENGGLASNYELPSLLANSSNNSVTIGAKPDLTTVITPIANKTVLTNKDIDTLVKNGIDIKTILQQVNNNEFSLIPGIVMKVLNGGINLPFGSKQEFNLDNNKKEEGNRI